MAAHKNKQKRASMREGPLAALFRKTEEIDEVGGQQPEADGAEPSGRLGDSESAGRARESSSPSAERSRPKDRKAHEEVEDRLPAPETAAAANIPTPQERLRHAFSSEIPENVMMRGDETAAREVHSDYMGA
jgi:cell division protein FtsZ